MNSESNNHIYFRDKNDENIISFHFDGTVTVHIELRKAAVFMFHTLERYYAVGAQGYLIVTVSNYDLIFNENGLSWSGTVSDDFKEVMRLMNKFSEMNALK